MDLSRANGREYTGSFASIRGHKLDASCHHGSERGRRIHTPQPYPRGCAQVLDIFRRSGDEMGPVTAPEFPATVRTTDERADEMHQMFG